MRWPSSERCHIDTIYVDFENSMEIKSWRSCPYGLIKTMDQLINVYGTENRELKSAEITLKDLYY